MSAAALDALESAPKLYLRTRVHPGAQGLASKGLLFETFDSIYENAADFDEVYSSIAARILDAAQGGDVTYAVPGHPLMAERSVGLILKLAEKEAIPVKIIGSTSFIDATFEALAIPVGKGLKLIDALALDDVLPSTDCPNLIYQVYDKITASNVKLALMDFYPDEYDVYVVSSAGGSDARVEKLPLYALDRRDYDHLTSVYVPEMQRKDQSAG